MFRTTLAALLALLIAPPAGAAILRVSATAPGPTHDGASWPTAYTAIQPVLDAAQPGDELWVAAGTYTGDLTLKSRVALYGGFRGDEATRSQREANGNIAVVSAANVNAPAGTDAAIVDGLTFDSSPVVSSTTDLHIENCRFRRNGIRQTGGRLVVNRCVFVKPISGPAVYASNATAFVTNSDVRGCFLGGGGYGIPASIDFSLGAITLIASRGIIEGNIIADNHNFSYGAWQTYGGGAGIYVAGSVVTVERNRITDNSTEMQGFTGGGAQGGGIRANSGTYVIANNLIADNLVSGSGGLSGGASGGGAFLTNCSVRFVNNTVARNRAFADGGIGGSVVGGGIYFASDADTGAPYVASNNIVAFNDTGVAWYGAAPVWKHNGMFGNGKIYPDFAGTDGNISADPLFADAANGDYRLQPLSPAIDAGDDLSTEGAYDLDGAFRIQGAHVDMGAFEAPVGPEFTMADVARALRIAGGIVSAQPADLQRLRYPQYGGVVSLADAARLARKVAGLEPNP